MRKGNHQAELELKIILKQSTENNQEILKSNIVNFILTEAKHDT